MVTTVFETHSTSTDNEARLRPAGSMSTYRRWASGKVKKWGSYRQVADRMRSFLFETVRDYDGRRILHIGHRATQYSLDHWILGQSLEAVLSNPWEWQARLDVCFGRGDWPIRVAA